MFKWKSKRTIQFKNADAEIWKQQIIKDNGLNTGENISIKYLALALVGSIKTSSLITAHSKHNYVLDELKTMC